MSSHPIDRLNIQVVRGALISDTDRRNIISFCSRAFEEEMEALFNNTLFIRTENGLLPSPADEEVMILRLSKTPYLDLSAPLSAEWREGELW